MDSTASGGGRCFKSYHLFLLHDFWASNQLLGNGSARDL